MVETYDGFSATVGKPYYIPHNKIDDFCEITKDRTTFSVAVFADVIKKLPVTISK
ncbi:MAG: hypothetical protein IT292_01190 [Deltaproteobacteria bacterium]|nr:hypothetical protein [Deltaproteobacteria bacterium]